MPKFTAPKLSFATNRKTLWMAILVSIALGYLTWHCIYTWRYGYVESAISKSDSPIWLIVSDTAYRVKQRPTKESDVIAFLELALLKVRPSSLEGGEVNKDQITAIATILYKSLKVAGQPDVLYQSGPDTIVNLVLQSGLTPATEEAGQSMNEGKTEVVVKLFDQCKNELLQRLQEPESIVKSKDILDRLLQFKNRETDPKLDLSKILAEDLVNKTGSQTGQNAPVSNQNQYLVYWPQIYQFMVRCIDVLQDDAALRDARFWLTFAGGKDTIAMWALFWFVVITLILRTLIARREDAQLAKLRGNLSEWEVNLQQNELNLFSKVNKAIDERRIELRRSGSAPILEKMLGLAGAELAVRENDSQPDSLLVWTETVRENNASSRWLLGWCGRALPTVGFIFKVYGIAWAMKDSDTIARATGAFEQAAAIAHVSGALGLAFSATFGAFLLSLIVGFADSWQAHYERKVLNRLENAIVPLLLVPPESPVFRRHPPDNLDGPHVVLDRR